MLVRKEAVFFSALYHMYCFSSFVRVTGCDRLEGLGSNSSRKDVSSSLGTPLAGPKLRALRMMATYLTDRDADLSSW